jgi:hypothetical protein
MIYRTDSEGLLSFVDEAWNEFAVANSAPHIAGHLVVGAPVESFIENSDIITVYRALLTRARGLGEPIRFPFRADSARLKRHMLMEIKALRDGGFEFRTEMLSEEPKKASEWALPPEEDEILRMCSFCGRARWDLEWHEIDEVIRLADLFGERKYWKISHGSCPDCLSRRMREIKNG